MREAKVDHKACQTGPLTPQGALRPKQPSCSDCYNPLMPEQSLLSLTERINHIARPHRGSPLWRRQTAALLRETFFEICDQLGTTFLVEVGAHGAETSIRFMESRGRTALALEANPYTYEALTQFARNAGVVVSNLAVSSETGMKTLNIPLDSDHTSLVSLTASLLDRVDSSNSVQVSVQAATLDSILKETDERHKYVVWLDVEGATLDVLSGARSLLASGDLKLLFVEVETVEYWQGSGTDSDVENFLARHGFVPLIRDAEFPDQYNVIFVSEQCARDLIDVCSQYWLSIESIRVTKFERFAHALKQRVRIRTRIRSLVQRIR